MEADAIKGIIDAFQMQFIRRPIRYQLQCQPVEFVYESMTHAKEIVRLLQGLDCRINLIRFHQIPGVDLHGADEKKMESFRDYLTNHGLFTTIRASRGQEVG